MKKKGLLIFTLVALTTMVGLVITYAGKVSVLYLKTDEVLARLEQSAKTNHQGPNSLVGTHLRIHGTLKPGSKEEIRGRRVDYRFKIMGKSGRSIVVRYRGVLPDTFRDKAELVVEGKLLKPNLFKAYTVLAKCPTKYKEEKGYGKKHKAKARHKPNT